MGLLEVTEHSLRFLTVIGTAVVLCFCFYAAYKLGADTTSQKVIVILLTVAFAFRVYELIPIASAIALLQWRGEVLDFIKHPFAGHPYEGPDRRQ